MTRSKTVLTLFAVATLAATGCATAPQSGREGRVSGESAYLRPMLSPGAQFAALPHYVQNTVRAQAGIAQFDRVETDETPDGVVYRIYFQNSGSYPPLFVSANGDVLNPDYSIAVAAVHASQSGPVKLGDLPDEVVKILQQQAPHSEISDIERQAWGDRSVFIFTFKGERPSARLYVRSDGLVLKEGTK